MVFRTRKPSRNVFSLEKLPSGLSRYWMGMDAMRKLLAREKMVISVSISKPCERMGKDLTNRGDMARMPVMTSSICRPRFQNMLMQRRTSMLPLLWNGRLFSVK